MPKTRVVRMTVSDTMTYSREKTVEVEVPHDADDETIRAAAIDKAKNAGRK